MKSVVYKETKQTINFISSISINLKKILKNFGIYNVWKKNVFGTL